MKVLKPKKQIDMVTLSVRVPQELNERLKRCQADAEGEGFTFSVADVVIAALDKAISSASKDLETARRSRDDGKPHSINTGTSAGKDEAHSAQAE